MLILDLLPLETLLLFIGATLLLALAPGPDNLYVLAESMRSGARTGLIIILGLNTGILLQTSLVALGLASLISNSDWAYNLIRWLGATYLLYLAYQALSSLSRAPRQADPLPAAGLAPPPETQNLGRFYRRGLIMNLTNPKVLIFFIAFLPQFSDPGRGYLALQLLLLGGLFALGSFIVFAAISLAGARLGNWFKRSPRAEPYLNGLTGLVFLGLAINLLISA